jgi:hypothetical protein
MSSVFCFSLFYRHAWDMAAETCLAQLPMLLSDPNAEFQVKSQSTTSSQLWCRRFNGCFSKGPDASSHISVCDKEYTTAAKDLNVCCNTQWGFFLLACQMMPAKSFLYRAIDCIRDMVTAWFWKEETTWAATYCSPGIHTHTLSLSPQKLCCLCFCSKHMRMPKP